VGPSLGARSVRPFPEESHSEAGRLSRRAAHRLDQVALPSVALGPERGGYHEFFKARASFEPLDSGYEPRNPLHNHYREACSQHGEHLAADNHHPEALAASPVVGRPSDVDDPQGLAIRDRTGAKSSPVAST